jgi:hypothetical protein
MNTPSLPPDDLPPLQMTQMDEMLLKNLEEVIGKQFYTFSGQIIRALLSNCQWQIKTNINALTVVISCPDMEIYWQIINAVPDIAKKLKRFSQTAIIRICPPIDQGTPWEIAISEISSYEDWLNS